VPQAELSGKAGNSLEGLAMGLSIGCLVHCLALPLVIALLPATARWLDLPESFHLWVLLTALPISLFILLSSCRRHGDHMPLLMGTNGLTLMACALLVPDQVMETMVTSIGALLLAGAHFVNWRLRSRHRHREDPA